MVEIELFSTKVTCHRQDNGGCIRLFENLKQRRLNFLILTPSRKVLDTTMEVITAEMQNRKNIIYRFLGNSGNEINLPDR